MAKNKGKMTYGRGEISAKTTFWNKLPKPFFVLAPMANVTDSVFRKIIAKYGKPDVIWTEFVSADGLCSKRGKKVLLRDLVYSEKERPIVAQLFTGHPEVMRKAAKLCKKLKFDGIDINMGCPDRAVEKQGGGAAMIRNYNSAIEVIQAAREGFISKALNTKSEVRNKFKIQNLKIKNLEPNLNVSIPVSVKTRIGYNTIDWNWIRLLLEQNLPALTIHLRTRKEMSNVPAHWDLMPEIIKLRNEICPQTLIIGNGDVISLKQAKELAKKYKCDGVMIGRGIFGTPWFFSKEIQSPKSEVNSKLEIQNSRTTKEKLQIMLEHTKLFEKTYCGRKRYKNFAVMKKHFKAYVSGFDGAKELRVKLMGTNNFKEVKKLVDEYLLSVKLL